VSVGISLSLGHDTFQVQPLGRREEVAPAFLNGEYAREHGAGRGDDALKRALPSSERQPAQVLSVQPEDVERGVVHVALAREQAAEVLPSFGIQRHDSPSRITFLTRSSSRTQ
jgi:hypothetical protein